MTVMRFRSRPSRARGLKHIYDGYHRGEAAVAPLAGAWIETLDKLKIIYHIIVAPLAGAWIETGAGFFCPKKIQSRAPRGRVD